ncbi:hypothetical protein B0A50_03558 [Salinomyces thailandicus]|uniref:Uncharacterized protein n=1 Tax=Salinomyces thailandicus TaxID=706561 RepID=A0A4U0U5V8_9PEZI|nr:hypothetical protein B0A50_03558 [Salinomyces thailandica]
MNTPVLVRAYSGNSITGISLSVPTAPQDAPQPLPPVSSYSFASILRSADCPEFQYAIDGIAEICAKSRLSLADEYAAHLPPLGEITAANSTAARPHLLRSGMRRPLTSVPEASSDSSESSGRVKKQDAALSLLLKHEAAHSSARHMRVGSMGRAIPVESTMSLAPDPELMQSGIPTIASAHAQSRRRMRSVEPQLSPSEATTSLQQLIGVK